jgi:hypothetical protein
VSESLTLDQLPALRERTDKAAARIHARLSEHLDTVQMLFSPRRVLGRYVQTTDGIPGPRGDKAHLQIKEQFAQISGKPYALAGDLGEEPLPIGQKLDLQPWRYDHVIDDHTITITSPLRWALCYSGAYTPDELRKTLATGADRRASDLRQYLVGALALRLLLEAFPGIEALFADLGYEVIVEPNLSLGPLAIVSIRSTVPTFRPADDLILTATRFSGVPAFFELIADADLRAIESARD